MKAYFYVRKFVALIFIFFFLTSSPTRAALGEKAKTLHLDESADPDHTYSEEKHDHYTVHTDQNPVLTIKEFCSNDTGIVFAVSWIGRHPPELKTVLGSYWSGFESAQTAAPKMLGQKQQTLKTEHLVVKRSGHLRTLRGLAYDPALLPEDVSADELR